MDSMLSEAKRLAENVFRSSEGGSEIEELAMAMTNLIAYVAGKFNEHENDDED